MSIPHNKGENYCGNFYNYGARALFLLFYYKQDTESEAC